MKLQYITQEIAGKSHWQLAEEACRAGVRWVQLRVKNMPLEEWKEIAMKTKAITDQYQATLIINDSLQVALAAGAHGVHLGKQDMSVAEAKKQVPTGFIVGGTANTFEDIIRLAEEGADYIGLGPFRFTTTKEKLSPVLGLEGYSQIMQQCLLSNISVPVVAIGGIVPEDLPKLMETGIAGVAVASAIAHGTDKKDVVDQFNNYLNYASTKNS
jgi:thiamine-phosphate pyrophosphorylase